jgi:hypothetical protein
MNAFRLSLISENSRLCHMADKPDGAALIVDVYRKHFDKMPKRFLEALADVARVNAIRGENGRLI